MWQIETRNKYVQKIAEVGGSLYDKLANFVDDMQKIVKASLNDEISKISISAISVDSSCECYVLTAVLGFGYYEKTEEL